MQLQRCRLPFRDSYIVNDHEVWWTISAISYDEDASSGEVTHDVSSPYTFKNVLQVRY